MAGKHGMVDVVAATLHHLTIQNGGISRSAREMRADAAAVVDAMRHPTEEMLQAAAAIDLSAHPEAGGTVYWQAMIDAAIAEFKGRDPALTLTARR